MLYDYLNLEKVSGNSRSSQFERCRISTWHGWLSHGSWYTFAIQNKRTRTIRQ